MSCISGKRLLEDDEIASTMEDVSDPEDPEPDSNYCDLLCTLALAHGTISDSRLRRGDC